MKDGYRIFDSDTHVGPAAGILETYMTEAERKRLEPWEEFKQESPYDKSGKEYVFRRYNRTYPRVLGADINDAAPASGQIGNMTPPERERPIAPHTDSDPAARIADMDFEGVDVNLTLPSGWFGTFTANEDVELEMAMYRAYHRWMSDYCGAYPDRIKGVILACGRDIEGSLEEIARCAKEDWPLAVFVYAPYGMPLDHPRFEPVFAAAQENDLSIALHTFTSMPPYSPGGLDTWDNFWIQRSAAHPWSGMRNMAALLGAGVMDRYPRLRIGVLEAGHSWLPFWLRRLDEHVHTSGKNLPKLEMMPSEYVKSGRFFMSIEMSEGQKLTQNVLDDVGDEVLMYASDYPHSESWFPKSVRTVMGWDLPDDTKRKLFWDNAVKYYARFKESAVPAL